MNANAKNYPQPVEDTDNAPFLRGWRNGRLMLQRCTSCQKEIFYPRPMCPHCWSDELKWFEASGVGKIVSYSLIHRPNHPAFSDEVPIALAEIRLVEGVTMLARMLEGLPQTGMSVVLISDDNVVARYPLPVFRPLT